MVDNLKDRFTKPNERKVILKGSGDRIYKCCSDFDHLIKEFALPDTFTSWYLMTNLHVWFFLVRLARETEDGPRVKKQLMYAMWLDANKRIKLLNKDLRPRHYMDELSNQFYGAVLAYDEGLLSTDEVLAGALWRNIWDMKYVDPTLLTLAVEYVRKQVVHLDTQDLNDICLGFVSFMPLHGDTVHKSLGQRNRELYYHQHKSS